MLLPAECRLTCPGSTVHKPEPTSFLSEFPFSFRDSPILMFRFPAFNSPAGGVTRICQDAPWLVGAERRSRRRGHGDEWHPSNSPPLAGGVRGGGRFLNSTPPPVSSPVPANSGGIFDKRGGRKEMPRGLSERSGDPAIGAAGSFTSPMCIICIFGLTYYCLVYNFIQ